MKSKFFVFLSYLLTQSIGLIFFLIILPNYVIAQVNCPVYCPQTYPSYPQGICSSHGNPNPNICISSNYLCSFPPTDVCYCCLSDPGPTPTCTPHGYSCNPADPNSWCCNDEDSCIGYCMVYISPTPTLVPTLTPLPTIPVSITPSYPKCTGRDGIDPCIQYGCVPNPDINPCTIHGGRCDLVLEPTPPIPYPVYICSPTSCRCGHSMDDCPVDLHGEPPPDYEWTCKTGWPSFSCSQEDQDGGGVRCGPGKINCDLGHGDIPCAGISPDPCPYECGNPYATCQNGICREATTCGSIPGGPGACVEEQFCPPEDIWPIPDACVPPLVCCSEPGCTGIFSGERGSCYFINCPPNTFFEGINPPFSETGCPLLQVCCTQPSSEWIERNTLNPKCSVNGGEGINTAIGCISVTSQNDLLLFILPWAIGVAGGTSFILIIVAGYLIMASAGDPRRAKAGKELLGAAIAGLLMIIFSIYILDVIGLRILRIPGI